jgi:hypothetical protein
MVGIQQDSFNPLRQTTCFEDAYLKDFSAKGFGYLSLGTLGLGIISTAISTNPIGLLAGIGGFVMYGIGFLDAKKDAETIRQVCVLHSPIPLKPSSPVPPPAPPSYRFP